MRRRFALKAIAAGALSLVGCQCVIKKEMPAEMYWDDLNKKWIHFEKIEFSSSISEIKTKTGREFIFANNACWVTDKEKFKEYFPNNKLLVPMHNASKPQFPKDKFIDGVNNDMRNGVMKKEYIGQYYEIIHKDLNLHTILYI